MERITNRHLEGMIKLINEATHSPVASYTKHSDGRFTANPGNYHLDGAYGGYSLERMSNEGGGVSDVFNHGHMPKRELYGMLRAFYAGIMVAKEESR